MRLKSIEIAGFKSFAKKSTMSFDVPVTSVVGPNGSGKSNVVEAFRFVLGEQSMKSMRGKSGGDLIFRGSSNTSKLSRASVSIIFDNTDKVFHFPITEDSKAPVLFDEITFTREIFADGTSSYLMNGTEVRLKQMVELLSSVNIGASGHHIISQGEADSILRASPKDRREMLEDSLGLKVYHYRIRESENKLARSTETLKDVQLLRKEIAPHLNFLKKQVEKIEKGREIRTSLEESLLQYMSIEKAELTKEESRIHDALHTIEKNKKSLEHELSQIGEVSTTVDSTQTERNNLKNDISQIRESRRDVESKLNRLHGMIEVERRMASGVASSVIFENSEYEEMLFKLESLLSTEDIRHILETISELVMKLKDRQPKVSSNTESLKKLALELEDLERDLKNLISKEGSITQRLQDLENERENMLANSEQSTAKKYQIIADIKGCESERAILNMSKSVWNERKESFEFELKEAGFLFGPNFLYSLQSKNDIGMIPINIHDLKRNIDRLKIRLDEHSGIGNEVVGEYESTKERDIFLTREISDIENSILNLQNIILDLKKALDEKFTTGVSVINERFGEFFKTMFGGGSAFLSITIEKKKKRKDADMEDEVYSEEGEEEEDDRFMERGIDVHVNLPEKKVKELHMLSGGERSLVSIALLFAISQVNPPPFLVLDETDAALDEANSRRYGDMVERLSEYSQLIVVTHNRETMSRANVLYGVTIGSDGASKLLSIKFDEAVKVAK